MTFNILFVIIRWHNDYTILEICNYMYYDATWHYLPNLTGCTMFWNLPFLKTAWTFNTFQQIKQQTDKSSKKQHKAKQPPFTNSIVYRVAHLTHGQLATLESTRSPAVTEGPHEHTVSWNMVKCCTNARRIALEKACKGEWPWLMTF